MHDQNWVRFHLNSNDLSGHIIHVLFPQMIESLRVYLIIALVGESGDNCLAMDDFLQVQRGPIMVGIRYHNTTW